MFVRWKRRKKTPAKPGRRVQRHRTEGDSLYCVIVESKRVNGAPRQKVVCYLAGVNEHDCDKTWLRVDFWDYVSAKLDRLPLAGRERKKIEESIAKVVKPVTEEEALAFKKARRNYQEKKAQLIQTLRIMKLLGVS